MSRTPLGNSFLGMRQHAPLRHSRTARGPRILQHQHAILVDVEIVAIDARLHVRVVVEDHARGRCAAQSARIRGGRS